LLSLEECGPPPSATADSVEGLVAPPGTIVTEVMERGPTTEVRGYTPVTPIVIRRFYQDNDEIEILQIEDEIVESEGLVADRERGFRTLSKANVVCQTGSTVLFVVAEELSGGE